MKYSNYVIELKKENHTFLFNTKNNISLKIENKLLDKIEKDNHIKSEFESFLKSQDFDEKENELDKMIELFRKRDETTLRIIILAHGDCNFRCKYCYEKFSNCTITSQKTGIIDFVNQKLSKKNFEDLHVSWFGGEPLLGYRDILDLSKELIAISQKLGIRYHADMTTNGYLLNRTVLDRLVTECYVKTYQVTVDGSREGHDNQRILKNGHGSYDRIMKNLKNAINLESQFHVMIRLNVSQENYKNIEKFLLEDAQVFKNDKRFHLLFRNVGDWGCGDRKEGYEVKRFESDVSFELSKSAIKLGYRLFDDFVFRSNYSSCYAQKPNSYTIDTKGNLLKCTVSLYDEENKIGELGNSVINENNQKRWVHSYQFDSKCQKCQLLLVCNSGACPKRDIFNETSFEEKCFKMRRNIMNNFELSIYSNNINYELKAD